ncbi:MAG: hypothetical protein EAZ08_05830 [Cytophagales bacterium]|nr:MAG: hypothetical protein EAZ08_05830 [Cytophagales bacterium]
MIFEAKDENLWISPQYLPENLENDKAFKKQMNKSKLVLVFRFARFMPDNVMINFLSRYGSFANDLYWENGIYFTKYQTDCIVLRENENDLHVFIDKNQENEGLLREIVVAFAEFGKNAKTQISLDNQNFVSFQNLKEKFAKNATEIESEQRNILKVESFRIFDNRYSNIPITTGTGEELKKENIINMLQKILALIDEANINEVFTELDELNIKSPQINKLRQEFIHGGVGYDFYDRLKMAVKSELEKGNGSFTSPSNGTSEYDLKTLYNTLNQKLNDEQLNLFCQLHFEEVYNNFSLGQSKTTKVSALLDFAKRRNLLEKLEKDLQDF